MNIEGSRCECILFIGVLYGNESGDKEGSDGDDKVSNKIENGVISCSLLEMLEDTKIADLDNLFLGRRQLQIREDGLERARIFVGSTTEPTLFGIDRR